MKITRKQLLKTALAASISLSAGAYPSGSAEAAPAESAALPPQRVAAISALLPAAPRGFGPPCRGDRRAEWDALRARPTFAKAISEGEKHLTAPFPAWDDSLYLQFSRTGQRPPGEKMMSARHGFLAPLVYAECLENQGRFVPRIEQVLHEFATEKTWTLPAHDADLTSFHGTNYFVDLGASSFAGELAQALYLLNGVISPAVRAEVMAALETRIFAPMRTAYQTGKGPWWMTADMNWNAVCLAGTTFAALAVLPTREERAFFAAGGERYSHHYLDGYQTDGFCKEGLGYYNYGFGHYIVLRETLWQATGGQVDLFGDPKVRQIATYGPRLEIENGEWPAIGDCPFEKKVDDWVLGYCSRALSLGLTAAEQQDYANPEALVRGCLDAFPNSLSHPIPGAAASPIGIHSNFDRSGLLVVRPTAGSACRLAAALQGGNNNKPHNHNDIGSFTLVLGKEPLVGDPGGPYVYTNKTFSKERYTAFKLFASYGHPVPLLGGIQQRPGPGTDARVLKTVLTDPADTLSLDIAAAYPPGVVTKLVRTFHYDRTGAGSLMVEDEFAFPTGGVKPFEVALTTHGDWKQTAPDTLTFTRGGETVTATVAVPGGAGGFTLSHEVIEENCIPFTRLGLRLNQPLAAGRVTVTFRPLAG